MNAREILLNALTKTGKQTVTRLEVINLAKELNLTEPQWFTKNNEYRVGRGLFRVPAFEKLNDTVENVVPLKTNPVAQAVNQITTVQTMLDTESLVPNVYKNYVPFGHFDDLVSIIGSNQFYPIFITGHSGNGKTMSVEQACAKLKRKFVLISMTPETDEGDLLGNYVLINGQMVWRDGPVTVAARQGAVLCIDEIDYGAQNLASLQRVLEGKPFLLKKKNEIVTPAEGFTIIATANTKGKGSDDGRYMFTNILNEAFLERFLNTYEQSWPENKVERKIVNKELQSLGIDDDDFAVKLVDWAEVIRKTFDEGGIDEVISTRRLTHITKTFSVFKDRLKSIELCLNRFDNETKTTFLDLYTKIDASVLPEQPEVEIEIKQALSEEHLKSLIPEYKNIPF
jgi:MoxR-like ATPase